MDPPNFQCCRGSGRRPPGIRTPQTLRVAVRQSGAALHRGPAVGSNWIARRSALHACCALAVLYRNIARPWTADELSRKVGPGQDRGHPHRTSSRLGSLIQQVQFSRRFQRARGEVNLLVTKSSDFSANSEKPSSAIIYLFHTRRLAQREQHCSYHSNMIGVIGKTTNRNVLSALPLDRASWVSSRQLLHPSQHFLFGCLTRPMQSLTASYDSSLDNLWVGGSKENGPPNHSISPVDHSVPPIGKSANSPKGSLAS